jgi:hypothetical protein
MRFPGDLRLDEVKRAFEASRASIHHKTERPGRRAADEEGERRTGRAGLSRRAHCAFFGVLGLFLPTI